MSNPWSDLTEAQRGQIREAHAEAKTAVDHLWEQLTARTWEQLRAAAYTAIPALEAEAESSSDAREALASLARILSDDWDGLEGRPFSA